MGIFGRLRRGRPGTLRGADSADTAHLRTWAAARAGVEAFVEPRTTVTDTTVVLVAKDGEWTRRRAPGQAPSSRRRSCSRSAFCRASWSRIRRG